jgi:3-hydroxybutyryl-CoA dehydrogenase
MTLLQVQNGAAAAVRSSELRVADAADSHCSDLRGQAVERVGVVGLGATGSGIAQLCISAGLETLGFDRSATIAEEAIELRTYWQGRKDATRSVYDAPPVEHLQVVREVRALRECDLVVEATGDDLATKQNVLAELDSIVDADAVLATHTNFLSVTSIAARTDNPRRVVGLHVANIISPCTLVEVVRGELSDQDAVDAAVAFVKRLGKRAITCDDTPGFVINRVLIPALNDCVRLLEESGITPEDLDAGIQLGAGWSRGPCALIDRIGIDTFVNVAETLYASLRDPRMAPHHRLVRMRRAGLLGCKSGHGFFTYAGGGAARAVG